MRVTPSMYYKGLYANENNQLSNKLFDVNKQIASGIKIQYAHQDISTFTDTMRLDNEIVALGQIQKSTESGYKFSNQSDEILNEFDTKTTRIKTLLLAAVNDTNDVTSRDAIAAELRGIEKNLRTLANTSINGQYLFSGSAVDIKPISDDGSYNGNDTAMKSFLGSSVQQQYNLTGAELFLGEESLRRREVATNVQNSNLIAQYPALQSATDTSGSLAPSSNIRDLMGDTDNVIDTVNAKHFFYISGVKHDGTAFNEKVAMRDDETIDTLLTHIGNAFGNTLGSDLVNVRLNGAGEIVVEDKVKGSSKLDFHLVGAVDLSGGAAADVTNTDLLDSGEPDFEKIMLATSTAANPNLHVKEFVKSSYAPASGAASNIGGLLYDKTMFSNSGNTVSSNVSQIVKSTNAFATPSTKISEVADITKGTATTADDTLNGTQFVMSGTDINGIAFNAQIDFATAGSTFSLDGGVTNYDIFNVGTPRAAVAADDMTYQQLMDVVNMIVTDNIPATTSTDTDYDAAVVNSGYNGKTGLSYDGKIEFADLNTVATKATISLYDSNTGDFTPGATSPVMTFNTNNALTVRDPKTDFFKMVDEIITAVEDQKIHPDSTVGDIRNVGIENALSMMDDLQDHIFRAHSKVGAFSNTLNSSLERTATLEISTKTLRSSVIDTDLAEASLTLTQLTTNYQAMLSTVGRVSQLSLVNYL